MDSIDPKGTSTKRARIALEELAADPRTKEKASNLLLLIAQDRVKYVTSALQQLQLIAGTKDPTHKINL